MAWKWKKFKTDQGCGMTLIALGGAGFFLFCLLAPDPVPPAGKSITAKGRVPVSTSSPSPQAPQKEKPLKALRELMQKATTAEALVAIDKECVGDSVNNLMPGLLVELIPLVAKKKEYANLVECWKRMESLVLPDSRSFRQDLDRVIIISAQVFLCAGEEKAFRTMADIVLKIAPGSETRSFLEGERWARDKNLRKKACPRRLFTIVRRPEGEINLDGRLDEEVYQKLTPLPDPFYFQDESLPKGRKLGDGEGFKAYLFHDGTDLILAAMVTDPQLLTVHTGALPAASGAEVWFDSFDFFLDVERSLNLYHQIVIRARETPLCFTFETPVLHNGFMVFGRQIRTEAESLSGPVTVKLAVLDAQNFSMECRIALSYLFPKGDVSGRLASGTFRRIREFVRDPGTAESKRSVYQAISWSNMTFGLSPHQHDYFLFE